MCARCDAEALRTKASLDPAIVALLASLADKGLVTPDPAIVGIEAARGINEAYFREIGRIRAPVARIDIIAARRSDGGDVAVKAAIPLGVAHKSPAVLYCHGGGYAFGDLDTHEHVIRAWAAALQMPVFAVHYRRIPEHSYPAALEDALATVAAMRGSEWAERFGHDPVRIFAIGDSAGAHLALTTMLALRERGLPQLSGAGLMYGMYARRFDTWSHHAYGDGSVGLSSERMRWFWDRLMGEGASAGEPLKEPLGADLAGLPALALLAAEVDCLLDDTLDLVESCKRQGHRHSFDLARGAPHGFMHFTEGYEGTREALALLAKRLRAMV